MGDDQIELELVLMMVLCGCSSQSSSFYLLFLTERHGLLLSLLILIVVILQVLAGYELDTGSDLGSWKVMVLEWQGRSFVRPGFHGLGEELVVGCRLDLWRCVNGDRV